MENIISRTAPHPRKKNFWKIPLLLLCLSASCEKPVEEIRDYRDAYVGRYQFTTYSVTNWIMASPDGMITFPDERLPITVYDTVEYTGTVEKYETNRLKIIFQPNATEPEYVTTFPLHINGLLYMSIDSVTGELTSPEYDKAVSYGKVSGEFIHSDSLILFYGISVHFGHDVHHVYGKRVNTQ